MDAGARGDPLELARRLSAAFAGMPEVLAVAVGGSVAAGRSGDDSDVDLYVYARAEIPLERRAALAEGPPGPRAGRTSAEIDNRFFEPGDEWVDAATGRRVDVMYRRPEWIEEQVDRVLVHHLASVGYSTCFWHNVVESVALFDREGWFTALQARAAAPYPEPLRRSIVARNQPLLRRNLSSYLHQIERAVARGDAPSVNHRVAAFLASWFDLLFALNRVPHPGEKRLLEVAEARCPRRPPGMAGAVRALVAAVGGGPVVARAEALAEALEALLEEDGLLDDGAPPDDDGRPSADGR